MSNKKLFSENFEEISNDQELDELCKKFSGYDRAYLCQATHGLRIKTKEWMENLWQQYEPYADPHFLEDFKRQYTQRSFRLSIPGYLF